MYNYCMVEKYNFLYEASDGMIFCVKLVPNSSFNKILDYTQDYVRIKISSPPIENKANKELIEFLSDILDINKSKIKIISGDKSKLKKILLVNTNYDYVIQKIMFVLDSVHKEK